MTYGRIAMNQMRATAIGGAIAAALAFAATAHAGSPQADQRTARESQRPTSSAKLDEKLGSTRASAIVVGEVVGTRDLDITGPVEDQHRLIKVRSQDGKTIVVDVGDADALEGVEIEAGDRILAVGKHARINERPVLFAKTLGELHSVGEHRPAAQQQRQAAGNRQGAAPGQQQRVVSQQSAGRTQMNPDERSGSANLDGIATGETTISDVQGRYAKDGARSQRDVEIVEMFETENLEQDPYGAYDADFVWVTNAPWYMDWSDAESAWTNDYEVHSYDMYGYDGTDEWGLWDW